MYSHLDPYGVPVDIIAGSIDKDDLSAAAKAERAIQICLPLADPEVITYVRRWVAVADEQQVKSVAIEQLREVLKFSTCRHHSGRKEKIKATPVLERSLWNDLLSND